MTESDAWENWICFVLDGIKEVAEEGRDDLIMIRELRKEFAERARVDAPTASSERLMDLVFTRPYTTTKMVREAEGVTRRTARAHLDALTDAGMLERVKSGRHQLFRNRRLIDILAAKSDISDYRFHYINA